MLFARLKVCKDLAIAIRYLNVVRSKSAEAASKVSRSASHDKAIRTFVITASAFQTFPKVIEHGISSMLSLSLSGGFFSSETLSLSVSSNQFLTPNQFSFTTSAASSKSGI